MPAKSWRPPPKALRQTKPSGEFFMSFPGFLELLQTDIPDFIAYPLIAVGGVAGGFALFALFF